MEPSVHWKEQIGDDEERRFAEGAQRIGEIQAARNQRHGKGRALHRKVLLGLRASVEILGGLPAHAAQGLFAGAKRYDARVRLSNGGMDVASNRRPDIRGFALKVLGVSGEGVFGGPAPSQDFLLINRTAFGMRGPDEFFGLVTAASKGVPSVIAHFVRTHGFFAGLKQLGALQKEQSQPFFGFAGQPFNTCAAVACGQHACHVRVVPENSPPAAAPGDFVADMVERVRKGPVSYALQLQFFVDEQRTPIEDGRVAWSESDSPFVTVGRLTIPQQDPESVEGKTIGAEIEALKFDPWSALAAHRPLGAIMRARKVAYPISTKGRDA
jgi:hypothetical protein